MKNIKILFTGFFFIVNSLAFSQITVKEGSDAMYIFLGENTLTATGEIREINISRAVGKEKEFKTIGKITPVASAQELKRIAGEDILNQIQVINDLNSEAEAFDFIRKNPELSKYGILQLSLDFLKAMGILYADEEAKKLPKNTLVKYKAEFVSSRKEIKEAEIICGLSPKINKPSYQSLSENDSLVTVSWSVRAKGSEDAFLGEVWVSEKANAPFKKAGVTLAASSEDSEDIVFTWNQKTTPQLAYRFYLVPQTFLKLAGPKSDTVSAISSNYNNLSFVNNSIARDTLGGVYVSWDVLKNNNLLSGIIVERSRDTTGTYIVLDTIPAYAVSYLDTRILPNTYYKYRFKTLDIRGTESGGAAYVSGIYTPKRIALEAPEKVRMSYDKQGFPRISWTPVASAEISGYQVFRSSDIDRELSLVSNLIQDSVYVDTTVHNSRITYKYAVKTLNYENRSSEFSGEVFGNSQKKVLPKTPFDVETYAEPGKISLRWKDMTSFDEYIQGYVIYRKQSNEKEKNIEEELSIQDLKSRGFSKVNSAPTAEVLFTDTGIKSGHYYYYAVTAVDAFDVEGNALGAVHTSIPSFALKSPEIFARNTSKGIEITWTDASVNEIDSYTLYKRLATQTNPVQIGVVKKGTEKFTDTVVKTGELYFYTLRITSSDGVSSPLGTEKSVRKQ